MACKALKVNQHNQMKFCISIIFFLVGIFCIPQTTIGQANPFIGVLPANSGVVALGSTLDLTITIGNTGLSSIAVAKLRPIIQVPVSVTFLPDAQQTGLPTGWTILSNTGAQLRFCNSNVVIPGQTNFTIILKVRGVTVAPSTQFQGNINFGNGTTCAAGTSVAGDILADNAAQSTIQVVAGCSLGVSATVGSITCNGGTGIITASTTAASGPVEYSITGAAPFQSTNTFTVAAGPHTITAREVNNPLTCVATTTISVTEPSAILSPTLNIVQPTCTQSSGIVTITSPTIGLTFSIDGGSYGVYPASGYLLPTAAHTIIAKNASNCSSPLTNFTINPQPITSPAPVIGTVIQPNCSISTGTIVLQNLPTGAWIINPGNINGNTTSTTLNNITAGTYNFTVTNSVGCTSPPSATVIINAVIGAPGAPLINITQPTCTVGTGSASISSTTTNLLFSLDGGPFIAYPSGGYFGLASGSHSLNAQNSSGCTSPFANFLINPQPASPLTPLINITQPTCTVSTALITVTSATSGLTFSLDGGPFVFYPSQGFVATTGTHSLAVQNLDGCSPTIVNNIIVNPQPATPTVNTTATVITCFGGTSIITASASNGISPYDYSINGGSFVTSNVFPVSAGAYTLRAKDFNGCIGTSSIINIVQPLAITATASAPAIACNGGNTTISILAFGGVGAFEYSLNNGAFQTSNSFEVPAGPYTARVRLVNNPSCSTSINTAIVVSQPAILKTSLTGNAISFCGDSTTVEVRATGGRTPYVGTGNFKRAPGKWNFNVSDANGCASAAEILILPPGCIELEVFPNPTFNSITVNHSAAINASAYFQIFSVTGARIKTQYVTANIFRSNIDVSSLSSGTYLLIFVNGEEKQEKRFIKINK